MNLKWLIIILGLAASTLLLTPVLSAQSMDNEYYYHPTQYESSNAYDDYTLGYRQGYDHGASDRNAGMEFDFEHSEAYQRGTADFRSGYEEGYTDAFNRRPSQMMNEHGSYYGDRHMAPVEAFDDTGFRGRMMRLGVGNYESIDLSEVQSLRINGDVRVILFNERNFDGRSVILTADTPSLRFMQRGSFWTFGMNRHHTGSMIVEPLR